MSTHTDIIAELEWRGLINQSTDLDNLREETRNPITLYCGFDPTGPSLHAGHLVPLLMLRRFQMAGHRPIVLAGGATGKIGDPRDVGERSMNSDDTVADWAQRISGQLSRFVDFDGDNGAMLVNNNDWTADMSVITFLRDVGKHFSLSTMLSRDTVKRRLENDGISYTEFSYMLLQANDFVQLRRNHDCVLQIGGGDQWGNLVGGVDLNRRMDGAQVHALTVPLVTDSEGKKFGKSTGGGSLWLDPEMTSPYTWYQYFVNTADADVIRYLRWFTFLDKEELSRLETEVAERPFKREAQIRLAQEMTDLVHGPEATRGAELAAQALFGRADLRELDERTLASAVSETQVYETPADAGETIVDLLVGAGLADSKGAARRSIKEGGVYANNERVESEDFVPASEDFLHGRWLVLRRGKKNFAGVKRG
ncbi:tyrosine--tRNA ligase [Corynebacterium sanguinis]|uniref:Tyrosine--tRNA ligase n=1 Tax=Corynebacterium sanguinis TaxID=2594913 RepID=A0A6C1U014_9CORY|nr:tyrosine--tRNA ligase [Corynebacterium sanguinis]MCT1412991.1 tyrosine--tRNA ligase [Corynebacterium sanguinis]MCT1415162.1 tyrosine--tRNA ligase [Corynebacterium sanguinis]MCT1426473.1 tyrosine--tRNA ligase [Corynebacterium sanguinis]MCT1445578.1 tyrosine--tRNA ligase [Corynebacterium sanguinis]MCT1464521.1 tyrosine--tRNA ligase [Corynebacterium sanguinis]